MEEDNDEVDDDDELDELPMIEEDLACGLLLLFVEEVFSFLIVVWA